MRQPRRAGCSVCKIVVVAGSVIRSAATGDKREQLFLQHCDVEQLDLTRVKLRLKFVIQVGFRAAARRVLNTVLEEILWKVSPP